MEKPKKDFKVVSDEVWYSEENQKALHAIDENEYKWISPENVKLTEKAKTFLNAF